MTIRLLLCLLAILQIVAVLCAVAQPACAYVDPGSGLLAFQIICTTFAGIIFMIRKRISQLFRVKPSERHEDDKQK
jgi:hypothetical protein